MGCSAEIRLSVGCSAELGRAGPNNEGEDELGISRRSIGGNERGTVSERGLFSIGCVAKLDPREEVEDELGSFRLSASRSAELDLSKEREDEVGRSRRLSVGCPAELDIGEEVKDELDCARPGSSRLPTGCSVVLGPGMGGGDEPDTCRLPAVALSFRIRTGIRLFSIVAAVHLMMSAVRRRVET
jgi:hypothetical protein